MTNLASSFVICIPSTEEEMIDIAGEVARRERTAANFERQLENLEQLCSVMRWYLNTHRKPKEPT